MFKAILTITFLTTATAASAWDVPLMNRHVDQTNFIVGQGCSGTLIDGDHRLILTNYHCINDFVRSEEREVVALNGAVNTIKFEKLIDVPVSQKTYEDFKVVSQATYTGIIVAKDDSVDLALIQLRVTQLPYTMEAELFTGEKVYRGETAWAVGNPLGLDATVTRGTISSVNRMVAIGGVERPYFQVDVGIAPGNSGGALYNDEGILIGVPAAGAQGTSVGLAIPYTIIQEFLTENCYQEAWKKPVVLLQPLNQMPRVTKAQTHEECVAEKAKEE
jgi:S1-C subfamily serine protease